MIELWPHWLRPLWLLVLPVLTWLLIKRWHRRQRTGRWQLLVPARFHGHLLGGGSGHQRKLPWVILGLAWALAVLALLGPSWERLEQNRQRPADPLVILLQMTPAMLATDSPPTRLEQARRKILDLLEHRHDSQTALIVYAGSAHTLVPLSDDASTTRNLLEAVDPSIMPQAGQRADLAVQKGLALLAQSGLGAGRLLLIGAEVSDLEQAGIRRALGRHGPALSMLGIGTAAGVPVRQADGEFLKDAQGGILLPRLDSASLKRFIGSVGGHYRAARVDDLDLRRLGLFDNPQGLSEDAQAIRLDSWADQGYWLLLPLLLLAACAGRRGWLFCLPLLLALPQPSQAFEWRDLWWRPDQQGQRLLAAQRPQAAAERFEQPQWRGLALYEAGDYAAAAQAFARGDDAAAHYNRGTALARAGDLEGALEAYDLALERQPDLQAALDNQALVERELAERQGQAQSQASEAEADAAPGSETRGNSAGATGSTQAGNQAGTDEASPSADTPTDGNRREADGSDRAGNEDGQSGTPTAPSTGLDAEQRQALEQWLREIPDNPAQLLRRKFWYEQQLHQDTAQ